MKTSTFTLLGCPRMLTLGLMVVLTMWSSACRTTTVPATDWKPFVDYAGGFFVLMPIRPQESIKLQPSTDSLPVKVHEFIVAPDASIQLGVTYNDFSKALSNVASVGSARFFDTIQEAVLKRLGEGRLIYSRDGTFASYPMREIRFEALTKGVIYQARIIVAGHRMYQVVLISSAGIDVSATIETFFNSFRLLYGNEPR